MFSVKTYFGSDWIKMKYTFINIVNVFPFAKQEIRGCSEIQYSDPFLSSLQYMVDFIAGHNYMIY